jgi:hypothetical protein
MLFASTAPRVGSFALRMRSDEDNKNPFKPISLAYYELSRELVKARVGVDIYFIAKDVLTSLELVSTHFLASSTGGSIHLYSPFISEK